MSGGYADWQVAVLAALAPSLVVVAWDPLEGAMPEIASVSVPPLVWVVLLFVGLWPFMVPLLKQARSPATAGLLVGFMVSAVMLAMVIGLATVWGPMVLPAWIPFGTLAIGLGAGAGAVADGTVEAGRVSIGAGVLLLLIGIPLAWSGVYLLILVIGGGLIAVGWWSDRRVDA